MFHYIKVNSNLLRAKLATKIYYKAEAEVTSEKFSCIKLVNDNIEYLNSLMLTKIQVLKHKNKMANLI